MEEEVKNMDRKHMGQIVRQCNEGDLSDLISMILVRWHELQPEWEHFVLAVPMRDMKERRYTAEQLSQVLNQPCEDLDWDSERMWRFVCGER